MERFLVLERGEGIRRAVLAGLKAWGGSRAGDGPSLLVISPRAAGSGPLRVPPCRAVLLPGEGGGGRGELRAVSAVSYGLLYRTAGRERVGVLPIGYADGLLRSLSNRCAFYTADGFAPLRGRICMDMCMVDLTGKEHVQVGS